MSSNLGQIPIDTLPFQEVESFNESQNLYSNDFLQTVTASLPDPNNWTTFKNKGMHFIHINVNSLLPKSHEIRNIAYKTNSTIIGITETKLSKDIYDNEVNIMGYDIVRQDRNRHGGGVACYIKNDRAYNIRSNFIHDCENIFVELLLPKSRPIIVGIIYRPPNQSDFLDKITSGSSFQDIHHLNEQEIHILGDLNYNLLENGKYILNKNNKNTSSIPWLKGYSTFCNSNGLKQIIKTPTRVGNHNPSLLGHILTNSEELISASGVIDVGVSDHQLIYLTRKKMKEKVYKHTVKRMRSYKNYTPEDYLSNLSSTNFCDYSKFDDVDTALNHFLEKLNFTVNKIAPLKISVPRD